MLTNKIDFTVPTGWHELSDKQLRYVYRLLAMDLDADTLKVLCLICWSGTQVIGRQNKLAEDGSAIYLLKQRKNLFEVSTSQIAELLPYLDWVTQLPSMPVRPSKIKGKRALPADFEGVPFETYIVMDNLYQGYLKTQSDDLLDELASVLYPGLKVPDGGVLSILRTPLSAAERISAFYWLASLKDFFARRYPHFLQSASAPADSDNLLGSAEPSVEDAMNAQIRALTKGDVTKEQEILALDTWRALTELNAQAKEYKDFNDKYGKK